MPTFRVTYHIVRDEVWEVAAADASHALTRVFEAGFIVDDTTDMTHVSTVQTSRDPPEHQFEQEFMREEDEENAARSDRP